MAARRFPLYLHLSNREIMLGTCDQFNYCRDLDIYMYNKCNGTIMCLGFDTEPGGPAMQQEAMQQLLR